MALFNKNGTPYRKLAAKDFARFFAIVVTLDNFGSLGIHPEDVLALSSRVGRPWVIAIDDLEAFTDAFVYFGYGPADFIRFLSERTASKTRYGTDDELAIGALFLRHGTIELFNEDSIVTLKDSADLFDELYLLKHGAAQSLSETNRLYIRELSPLERSRSVANVRRAVRKRVGRNEHCPCGSRNLFKDCWGKP
jgi:hypothetical protein